VPQPKTIQKADSKRARKKSTKRDRLVHAAAECFREGGIRATTIKIIAARAEVPIGNVYYYFKTKEDFASAVVASLAESQASEQGRLDEMDPREALYVYVKSALASPATLSRHGGGLESLVCDLARESSSELERARALLAEEEEFVRRCFARVEEQSESPDRSRRLAQWLVTLVRGARAHTQLMGDAQLVSGLRREILARLKARLR
jgi:TetR/AcrR family transcriptional repressor of nem operon